MPKGKISEELDDRLYEKAMFATAADNANYLGNPEVVGGLIADYCMLVREILVKRANDALTKDATVEQLKDLRNHMAGVFSGRDPQYKQIAGWPSELDTRLRVQLGNYWQEHRAENDNDPFKAMFAWLCWAVSDSMQRAGGDHDLEQVALSNHTARAIQLLLGTDRRA